MVIYLAAFPPNSMRPGVRMFIQNDTTSHVQLYQATVNMTLQVLMVVYAPSKLTNSKCDN